MRFLKGLFFLLPLFILAVILTVGYLGNGAVKRRIVNFATQRKIPTEIERLKIDLPKGQAVFEGLLLCDQEGSFTAKIARAELTLDENEIFKGKRAVSLFLTNAFFSLPSDFSAFLTRKNKKLPFKEGGTLLRYSAEKIDAGKIPWLLSEDEKDKKAPLYIPALLIANASVLFEGGERPLIWHLTSLKGGNLAYPPELAENPWAVWHSYLEGYPNSVFQGELREDNSDPSISIMDFQIENFPAELVSALIPSDKASVACQGGNITAHGRLRFQGGKLLPGKIEIQAKNLTVRARADIKDKKGRIGSPDITLNDANFDLSMDVDDNPPYVHFEEAWKNQGSNVKSGRVEMTLDLRLKK